MDISFDFACVFIVWNTESAVGRNELQKQLMKEGIVDLAWDHWLP